MQNANAEGFRLSSQQKHLWLLQQAGHGIPYRVHCKIAVDGNVDIKILKAALNKVVERHEILRTTFHRLPEITIPLQSIANSSTIPVHEHNLSRCNREEQEAGIEELFQQKRQIDLDFENGPLLDISLVTLSRERHVLFITLPGLCADHASISNLFREIGRCYAACCQGEELPDKPTQYVDFAEWENELAESKSDETAREYWRTIDLRSLNASKLPFENQVSSNLQFNPDVFNFTLSTEVVAGVKSRSENQGVLSSVFLLACWQILLWRLTGQSSIVIGAEFDGRIEAELADALGLFERNLPYQCHLEENLRFSQLLQEARKSADELHKWQQLFCWDNILSSSGDLSSPPFFPFCFECREPTVSYSAADLVFSICGRRTFTDRFKVKLLFAVADDSIVAALQYDTHLYQLPDIQRLAEQYCTLLKSVIENPEAQISELEILSLAERQKVLEDFNRTTVEVVDDKMVHQLFEEKALGLPDQIALVCNNQQLSYSELNTRANQLAHHLRTLGVGPEQLVAICVKRSPDMVVGILGILKAGGAWLPLDPAYPKNRLAFMFKNARASVLLTQKSLVAELPDQYAKTVLLDADWPVISQHSKDNPDNLPEPTNVAYVIYTSGTTGQPKGVVIRHSALGHYVQAMRGQLAITSKDVYLHTASIAFSSSVRQLMLPLTHGARVVIATGDEIRQPVVLFEMIKSEGVTIIDIVPSYWRNCISALANLDVNARKILLDNCLRLIATASEPLLSDLPRKWTFELQHGARLINMFGQTETTGIVAVYPIGATKDADVKIVHVGRPIANTQIYLLDAKRRPVPVGVLGEIYIGGAGLARGYLNQPEITAERFVPNQISKELGARLYRTGDLGRYMPDGNIEFVGRTDQQVKVRGFRVELSEIESILNRHDAVRHAVVIAREDNPGEKRLVAYVVSNEEMPPTISDLREFLGEKLPDYMVPGTFVFLDALPLTPTGKVNRSGLPAPDHERPAMRGAYIAPRTEIETTLCRVWSGLLNLDKVGIEDDFFELGGDSILSIQMIARADQAGIRITAQQFLKHSTIRALASVAGITPVVQAEQGLVTGPLPLTPIIHWFFEQRPSDPNYYNQAVMLEVREGVDPALLCSVVQHLLVHHDVLRLRCVQTDSSWRQFIAEHEENVFFSRLDFSTLSQTNRFRTDDGTFMSHSEFHPTDGVEPHSVEAAVTEVQASLNLLKGPLVRVAFFDRGPSQPSRLLICIHHFAVDGVSWRIFLEDFQTAYEQLQRGTEVQLPPKTTSFKEWAHCLSEYAQSETLQQEISFWLEQSRSRTPSLPVDYPNAREDNTVASSRTVSRSLNIDETRILLQETPKAYHTQINDMLLTALVQTFANWTGSRSLLLDLEGHGREQIASQIDVSRTMGWFTTIFPVILDLDESFGPGETLKSIKEQLRVIPNRGIGYGLLRYLGRNSEVRDQLRRLPQSDLRFNYLGQFDQALSDSCLFKLTRESTGPVRSQGGMRRYLLDVFGSVVSGELQIDWTFSENVHRRATIEDLAERYMKELRSLMVHCQSPEIRSHTTSDLFVTKFSAPASFAQQRLWFLDQLDPGSAAYNFPNALRISGPIDVAVLQRSLSEIVRRHEVLRTSFAAVDGQPVQVVAPHQPLTLSVVDLSNLPESERQAEARRLVNFEAHQPFDLARGALIRASLLRLDKDDHVLVYVLHHIVYDGWSMGIFSRELSVLYEAFSRGDPSPLAELPMQYADFAVRQRQWLQGEPLEIQLSYWKKQLKDVPALELHSDWPRPAVQTFRGASHSLRLPKAESNQLKALSQQHKVSLFMTLLGAFKVLLHRHTGQDDIVVGSPIAGRNHEGVEDLIGFFVNSLVLRTNLRGNPTFADLLQRVREVCLDAYAHQDLPFEKLVEELQPERDLSRTPLFQVFFNMLSLEGHELKLPGLTAQPWTASEPDSKFDLTMYVRQINGEIHLKLAYNADLFRADRMAQMLAHFQVLLQSIVAAPDQQLSDLQLLPELERHRLSARHNLVRSTNPFMEFKKEAIEQSIPERFESQVEKYPNCIAVRTKRHQWTYSELNRTANQIAQTILRTCGVGEQRIGLLFEHDAPMIAGVLGVLKTGKTYVPLDPSSPGERLSYLLEDSRSTAILTNGRNVALTKTLTDGRLQLINTDEIDLHVSTDPPNLPISPETLAYILYTSGSTGVPKGVMQNHRNVLRHIRNYTNNLHINSGDRLTLLSSYSFDAAVMDIFGGLLNGAALHPMDIKEEDPAVLFHRVIKEKITIYHSTPTVYRYLTNTLTGREDLSNIRFVVLGGEEVHKKDVDLFKTFFSPHSIFVNGLGPTESTVTLQYFINHKTEIIGNIVPVGCPVEDTEVLLFNEAGKPTEVFGEIGIRGSHVALGYWQKPEMTKAVFLPDPRDAARRIYRTGDLGRLLPDGSIAFIGRKDFQVKIRGFRIELGEIEAVLAQHPAILEAAVIAREDEPGNPSPGTEQHLVAYVVTESEPAPTITELRSFLKTKLPDYMIPAIFLTRDSLPLTPNGKVDRRALPVPDQTRTSLQKAFVAPRNGVEEMLASIWAEILKLEQVGIYDNFFELGGHSLLAIQVISRTRKAFGVELRLRALFENPTVASLAMQIEQIEAPKVAPEEMGDLLADLESLSDEEAEDLLVQTNPKGI